MKKAGLGCAMIWLLVGCQQPPPANEEKKQSDATAKAVASMPKIIAPVEPSRIELDDLIKFSDPSLCELAPAGSQFMEGLLVLHDDGSPITLGRIDVSDKFRGAFGRPVLEVYHETFEDGERTDKIAHVPVNASWHGLKLVEISSSFTEGGDGWSHDFTFAEPFKKVRAVANAVGFHISPKGRQPLGNSETPPWVAISEDKGRTTLSCWF